MFISYWFYQSKNLKTVFLQSSMAKKYRADTPASPSWPYGVEDPVDKNGRIIALSDVGRSVDCSAEQSARAYKNFLTESVHLGPNVVDIQSLDWRREMMIKYFPSRFGSNPQALRKRFSDEQVLGIFRDLKEEAAGAIK